MKKSARAWPTIKKLANGNRTLYLSASDTYNWVNRDYAIWPDSKLAGRTLLAEFDSVGNLLDFQLSGGRGNQSNVNANEFNAIVADFLGFSDLLDSLAAVA